MAELEAAAVAFNIDHHQPQAAGGSDAYENLYWSCQSCNLAKTALWPDISEFTAGYRFIQIDLENPDIHIGSHPTDATRVSPKTRVGLFNIDTLGLNEHRMKTVRKLRIDAGHAAETVRGGLRLLQTMRIDELPPVMRARAISIRDKLRAEAADVETSTAEILRAIAVDASKSELIDRPGGRRQRRRYLKNLSPGTRRPR